MTTYLITIGEPEQNGVIADTFEEALIFVGRLIERLNVDNKFIGKYIYVKECIDGNYDGQEHLFSKKYLIEK